MKKLLFKPITNYMENRAKSIENALNGAEQAKIEAAKVKQNYEEQIGNIKTDSERLVNEARAKATKEYEEIIAVAKHEAEGILAKGREDVEREREEMLRQIKQQIAVLAIAAASKVVQSNMDTEANKNMVDKFIDEAGAA
jgi:F-type H+-transporting ATPase subunit b